MLAGKVAIAERNADVWTVIQDHTMAQVDGKRKLVAKLNAEIAQQEKLAANAAGYAAEDRDKVAKLKAGEDVTVTKGLDYAAMVAILKEAGWRAADFRRAKRMAELGEAGFEEYLDEVRRLSPDLRQTRILNKLYRRHVRVHRSAIRELEEPG